MKDANSAELKNSVQTGAEPLARLSDLAEYQAGLDRRLAGDWDEDKWTGYRTRFGVYGQKQPGVQMVRIKIPGGVLPVGWLKVLAKVNRTYAVGDAHVTTRQDVQIYSVPLERTPELLAELYGNGLTTREACGNTLRNITACALAGACPRELVDAGQVAESLAHSWLRHPLVQHMPRKVKMSVSGCATDCGASAIHDLAFVAVERDGAKGFRVLAGGGLGSQPRPAVEVLPFAREEELPAVVEALVRVHQRWSDRRNRNASRIKFVVKRLGEEKFTALFREELERVKGLAQRPFTPFAWRDGAAEALADRTPVGVLDAHDGSKAVVVSVPLGLLSSDQLDALHEIAVAAGVRELRATRDQNLALLGVAADAVADLARKVEAIGFQVPAARADEPDVISCPGTTTCRIGITNSQSLGRELFAQARSAPAGRDLAVRVSGCQNSCGLHHAGDFGLHGMAKKIDGRQAPHYQVHIGGSDRGLGEGIGISGPMIPARLAPQAIALLRDGYVSGRQEGESVRGWAERLGKAGIAALLAPIEGADADGLFVDWGDSADFPGAPQARGECAAPFAADEVLASLADDALLLADRQGLAGRDEDARQSLRTALLLTARRLLGLRAVPSDDDDAYAAVAASFRAAWAEAAGLIHAFDAAETAISGAPVEIAREAVFQYVDHARLLLEAPAGGDDAGVGDLSKVLELAL